jgi:hypothetical protein
VQPGEDPFTKQRQDKKERVKKQQKQQLANVKAAVKAGGMAALPPTLRLAAALPEHGKGRPAKRKELHDEVRVQKICGWCQAKAGLCHNTGECLLAMTQMAAP